MNGIESNDDCTFMDSSGSLRNTRVIPFSLENTRITNPDNLNSESVRRTGIDSGVAATANGCGDVKSGEVVRYVHSGLICSVRRRRETSQSLVSKYAYFYNYRYSTVPELSP